MKKTIMDERYEYAHAEVETSVSSDVQELGKSVHLLRDDLRGMIQKYRLWEISQASQELRAYYNKEQGKLLQSQLNASFKLYRKMRSDYLFLQRQSIKKTNGAI